MAHTLKVGDTVDVMDEGLLMLQRFAPPGAKPNNRGVIAEFMDEETAVIEFPLEGEDHSQSAPYPVKICKKVNY